MKYRLEWLLREVPVLAGINVTVLGVGIWAHILAVHLDPAIASSLALMVFVGLTSLNAASARLHRRGRGVVSWPLLGFYELLAVGAAWAIWSVGSGAS